MSESPNQTDPIQGASLPGAEGQAKGDATERNTAPEQTAPSTGRRAFRSIRRELTQEELGQPGAHKFLLADLERSEERCDQLEQFVSRYHEADKRAAVYEEKLRTVAAVDVAFGVGVGLGGAVMGLAPSVWDAKYAGPIALVVGLLLISGGAAVKVIRR